VGEKNHISYLHFSGLPFSSCASYCLGYECSLLKVVFGNTDVIDQVNITKILVELGVVRRFTHRETNQ
jgi:hypothetical protein